MRAALLVAVVFVIAGATATPARASFHWRERAKHAQEGSLRAEFSYRYDSASTFWDHGRLRIWSQGRLIVDYRPRYAFSGAYARPALSISQLDGTGPSEVIATVYSGGAHCCWATVIFTGTHRLTKAWGHYAAPMLRDVDGDGKPEFHGFDSRFAAAFGSFASSRLPAKVWSYAGGVLHDVTASYPGEVQADMAQQYASYQSALSAGDAEGVRGSLGAYAADGYTLGQGDAAMAVVQTAVDAGQTGTATSGNDPAYVTDYIGTLRGLLRTLGYDTSAPPDDE